MSAPARILLLGKDQALLNLRASVLIHFWYIATRATLRFDITDSAADLIVLCYTIPEQQRRSWIASVRTAIPNLLVITLDDFDSGPREGTDLTVNRNHGPAALVSAIYELLHERGLESKPWLTPDQQLLLDSLTSSPPN